MSRWDQVGTSRQDLFLSESLALRVAPSSGGVFSVMVLNAFPKRNREEMGAGVPALKLARLPSRPGAVERGACPPHAPQNLCVHNIIQ